MRASGSHQCEINPWLRRFSSAALQGANKTESLRPAPAVSRRSSILAVRREGSHWPSLDIATRLRSASPPLGQCLWMPRPPG